MAQNKIILALGLCLAALSALAAMPPLEEDGFALARPEGPARTWDFLGGLPRDGKLQTAAGLSAEGLGTTGTSSRVAAGFRLNDRFTPAGAFLFEIEFTCDPALVTDERILWDDLAITYRPKWTHRGFQLSIVPQRGALTPRLYLGFSNVTCRAMGPKLTLKKGKVNTLRFYFNADHRVFWDFQGIRQTSVIARGGALAPSLKYRPTIGDRSCSLYHPFPGHIRRLTITPCHTEQWSVGVTGRKAFMRGETSAAVRFKLTNRGDRRFSAVKVLAEQFAENDFTQACQRDLGGIAPGAELEFAVPVETRLATGWQPLRLAFTASDAAGGTVEFSRVFRVGIAPRMAPRLTALMWSYSGMPANVADFGFTHGHIRLGPHSSDAHDVAATLDYLDEALMTGLAITQPALLAWPGEKRDDPRYLRMTRDGSVAVNGRRAQPTPEVSNPEFAALARRQAAQMAGLIGDHPAFTGVLPCSELRDKTFPSFNTEHLRYRAETGREVPMEVKKRTLSLKVAKQRFPDGIVPEDDEVLAYYRWFWAGGDGWPGYTGAVAGEYRSIVRNKDFFSFWDPAVRCPPRWGSGGTVDMLNQWVYANPEPMNVAGPAEELFAMAAGRKGQQVGIMTQLICYRSRLAPTNAVIKNPPAWLARLPRADFPTIPPDVLQEATWTMLAKPVQAIMYHGWGTVFDTGVKTGYCYTCPESAARLKTLLREVVAPLGPTLKRLGRAESEVAVFESFTTCAMGGAASWGWSAPAITFLQRARLDPRVVYEETILRDGFGNAKVLYLPQCSFLTPPVIEKLREFRRAGGILVGDEQLLGALTADVRVPVVSFTAPPASDHTEDVEAYERERAAESKTAAATLRVKRVMCAQSERLRRDLAAHYVPRLDSSGPELPVYARRWRTVDYAVVVNDHRTFGDYVGQWGLIMEKGLPFSGSVSLADPEGKVKAVYELSRGGERKFVREGERVKVPVDFATNDGRLFAFLHERIAAAQLEAPKQVRRGGKMKVRFVVKGESGRPVNALLPVEVRAYDSTGRELDGAGYAAAEGGVCELELLTNLNDPPGDYRLVGRDRAGGFTATAVVRVAPGA